VNLYNDETNTAGIRPQKVQWIEDGSILAGKNIVIVDEVDGSLFEPFSLQHRSHPTLHLTIAERMLTS
jgi:hypothetical protein